MSTFVHFFPGKGKFGGKQTNKQKTISRRRIFTPEPKIVHQDEEIAEVEVFSVKEINAKQHISGVWFCVKKCSYGIIFQKHSAAAQRIDHFYPRTF